MPHGAEISSAEISSFGALARSHWERIAETAAITEHGRAPENKFRPLPTFTVPRLGCILDARWLFGCVDRRRLSWARTAHTQPGEPKRVKSKRRGVSLSPLALSGAVSGA